MGRPCRVQARDALYHLTARGIRNLPIFADGDDRDDFVGLLERVTRRHGWLCHAYCLMTTHYHLLVATPEANVAVGMRDLNGLWARTFNGRHRHSGHLFRERYYSDVVETDAHLLVTYRYIALNPVRAGLCAAACDWPWSSYPATVGLRRPPRFLLVEPVLACFSPVRGRAIARFRTFVEQSLGAGVD